MASGSGKIESDLRVALLTGASGWRDRNSTYARVELATAAILLALVAAVVAVLLMSAGLPGRGSAIDGAARWVLAGLGALTLLVAVAPSLAWPVGWRPRNPGPVRTFAAVRVGAAMVVVGCWTALLGPVSPAPVWVLGAVIGCEYTLTAWALGVHTSGPAWWWRFQRSGVHVGILLLTAGAALLNPDRWVALLKVPLSFQVMAVGAAVTCHGLERLRQAFDDRSERAARAVASEVHDRLANWLHDEVTSALRLLRFRQRSGDITPSQLGAELDRLDQLIRLRQLDELLASGAAQLPHIVQHYVRLAQDQGVDVVEVPHSDGAISLSGEAGYRVKRALGVLVPNAITAGASELAFRVEAVTGPAGNGESGPAEAGSGTGEPAGIVVEVEDNAGGFDLWAVPAGRGLDRLRQDLGPDAVSRMPVPGGSRLRVLIDQRPSPPDDQPHRTQRTGEP